MNKFFSGSNYFIRQVHIPPGTQPQDIITVTGVGFVDSNNTEIAGDMFVRIIVQVPRKLSEKQRRLLLELEKESFQSSAL